jgi:hypothetical protein
VSNDDTLYITLPLTFILVQLPPIQSSKTLQTAILVKDHCDFLDSRSFRERMVTGMRNHTDQLGLYIPRFPIWVSERVILSC